MAPWLSGCVCVVEQVLGPMFGLHVDEAGAGRSFPQARAVAAGDVKVGTRGKGVSSLMIHDNASVFFPSNAHDPTRDKTRRTDRALHPARGGDAQRGGAPAWRGRIQGLGVGGGWVALGWVRGRTET